METEQNNQGKVRFDAFMERVGCLCLKGTDYPVRRIPFTGYVTIEGGARLNAGDVLKAMELREGDVQEYITCDKGKRYLKVKMDVVRKVSLTDFIDDLLS